MVLSTMRPAVFQHSAPGRPAPPRFIFGWPRRRLGGVGRDVAHDRVDDLDPLPRDGLQRLVVPHPPRPALAVVPSEPVVRADEGVAAEDEQVLELPVPAALRGRGPDAGPGASVGGRHAAIARELVVPAERGYVDRRHQRRGGLGADSGHREQALVGLVARQRIRHEGVERLDVGVEGGYLPGEHPHRDVLAGRQPPPRARRRQHRLPEPPGPRRGRARARGGAREPAPAGGRAPGGPAELGQQRHLPAARRVDPFLERGVGLEQGRAQPVLRARPRRRRELALRRQDPQRGGPLGLLGRRPEGAGHAARGARDHLGVDDVGLRDAGEHPAGLLLGVSGQVGAGVPVRMGAREDQRADVALLVDDDQRAGTGPLEQPVDVVRPVVKLGPEDHVPAGVERARAVRPLPDVDPQEGHGRRPCCWHGVSSPLSRP